MGKFIDPKKASSYKLVYKSVEDPSFEDERTEGTMVHVDKKANARTRGVDLDVLNDEYRYDMQCPDDVDVEGDGEARDDQVFEDEYEAEFGQDFIRQMMMAPEGEEDEEESLGDYPKHDARGDIDKEFECMMKSEYQAYDMEVEENDPRTEGLMPVDAFVPALQEFVKGREQGTFVEGKEKGHFMEKLDTTGDEVFHAKGEGKFMTVLTSKKDIDIVESYHEGEAEAKKLVLQRLKKAEEEKLLKGEDPEAEVPTYEYVKVKEARPEKWDCQTVLTSLSTLENHPTVIAAEKGKIRINPKTGALIRQNKLTSKNLDALGVGSPLEKLAEAQQQKEEAGSDQADGEEEVEEEEDAGSVGESLITVIDTTVKRNKNEAPEEKRARKNQVKAEKKEMRLAKKSLKVAYKAETIRQRHVGPVAKQQQAQLSLR